MRWHRKHGFLGVSDGYTTSEDPGDWPALYEKSCKATDSNFRLVDKPRRHQSANNLPFPASPVGTISQTVVAILGERARLAPPFTWPGTGSSRPRRPGRERGRDAGMLACHPGGSEHDRSGTSLAVDLCRDMTVQMIEIFLQLIKATYST
jgi:hypothetical protein